MKKPIALTSGDPAGIGIELSGSAWSLLRDEFPFFLIADRRHVENQVNSIPICEISDPSQAKNAMGNGLPLYHFSFPELATPGKPSAENAASVISAIELAVEMAKEDEVAAVCTNPVSKMVLKQSAAFSYPGLTEFICKLCNSDLTAMMLASPMLKVVPLTTHIPLNEISEQITEDIIFIKVSVAYEALLEDFSIENPRIAVAGLNPHSGDGGTIGIEEQNIIGPTVKKIKDIGMSISGPHSADTMFHEEARKTYDAAICMYHDQGLIALKTLDFFGGINITLGLPIVRTSPDHGTAFEIAGKGLARNDSLVYALRTAQEIYSNRLKLSEQT